MKTSFLSWIEVNAPHITSLTASSRRNTGYPYEKEALQLIQNNLYKYSRFSKRQDHTSVHKEDELHRLLLSLPIHWKQLDVSLSDNRRHHLRLLDERGEMVSCSISHDIKKQETELSHNREKKTPFIDGSPFTPFIKLGLMHEDGRVNSSMRSKFHQINSFLLLIKPSIDLWMKKKREVLHLFDMGCGKGYITHAMAHYFSQLYPDRIRITGIDSRIDVIQSAKSAIISPCLSFSCSSIGKGAYSDLIMNGDSIGVVALHACDTATDVALIQAYQMKAELFFIAPCCHREMSLLLPKKALPFVQCHPILHQRFSTLITDGLRCSIMESLGWKVDAVEFIDPEHTPKNTLLRGFFTGVQKMLSRESIDSIKMMKKLPLLYRNTIGSKDSSLE